VAAAALGAMLGDSAAYWIGRVLKPDRWRMLSRGKGLSAYQWASRTLVKRGGPLILAARYIPVGRVAVNVVAGTLRYPYRQFLMFDVIAGFTWGAYATVIGFVAGAAVGENPLIGVGVGMALAVVIGWAVQRVLGRRLGFDSPPPPDDSMADDAGADGGPVP
jgi:membrane protein DedA with SNARE-associated domain